MSQTTLLSQPPFTAPRQSLRAHIVRITVALTAVLLAAVSSTVHAERPTTALDRKIDQAWQIAWSRFFHKDTQTFMDYLSSYEPGKELAHLPTAEEVGRQFPNPCGYSTGMEDGMILGGAMLSLICDRFAVTGEENLRNRADQVFRGMHRCATVHRVPGFIARNVCPEDLQSVYINSSRDQYTHFVHGLWKYYHSSLASQATKAMIRSLLSAVAERMIQFVTPENDYDFCRADGKRCPLGICRMWNVQAHEAARLPMIYAAAWDTTGNERYRRLWRKYAADAVTQSTGPVEKNPAYALLQMQCSLELLYRLEPDKDIRNTISKTMNHVGTLGQRRMAHTLLSISTKSAEEMRMLGPDWRHVETWIDQKGYRNPQWGPYRGIWHLIREAGESALIPLMVENPSMNTGQQKQLAEMILNTDYLHCSSCGVVYHLAAFWKTRRHQLLNE